MEPINKKRLLITFDYYPNTGGVARYLETYAAKHGLEVLAPRFSEKRPESEIRRSLSWFLWPKWLPLLFWTYFYSHRYERLVISHILPAGYAALLCGKPYAVILHGLDIVNAAKSGWKRYWAKKILDNAEEIIVNSRATGDLLRKSLGDLYNFKIEYPQIKPFVAPEKNFRDPEHTKGLRADFPDKKIILSLGRLVERKGQAKIIRLMPRILQEAPNAIFIIAGNGPEREKLQAIVVDLNLEEKIIFLGKIKEKELPDIYNLCDIFVVPSLPSKNDWEGFGVVCLEAAYFGKPVVVANTGGLPEAVENGKTGFVAHDDEELFQKIIILLKDGKLAKKMGEAGREWIRGKFLYDINHYSDI